MDIARLMYVSKAAPGVDGGTIEDILETARPRNARSGVSGLLVYSGTHFLQLLEGPEQQVGQIFDSIRADERHHDVVVLLTERAEARQFPGWSMGYELLENMDPPRGSGWFQLGQRALEAALPETVSPEVRVLFTSFHVFNTKAAAA